MSSKISKKTLDEFVKLGGYDIVKYDRKKRRWKGVSKASRVTKIHRDTITRLLKEFPVKPVREVMPKYYRDFKESTGYKRLKTEIGHKTWFNYAIRDVLTAFHFLGNKDIIYWTLEDVQNVRRNCLKMRSPETDDIHPNKATSLRRAIKALNMHKLLPALEHVSKPPAGKKLAWFLEEDDLIKLTHQIQRPDTLLYLYIGVTTGARHSGIVTLSPERVKTARGEMLIYEPKRKIFVPKVVPSCVLDLLNQYIVDFKFRGDQKTFGSSYSVYNQRLTKAGRNAGLSDITSTHILKHTFVSQASFHGVSLDVISTQTGTEEGTLKKFYRAENIRRIRHELLGEDYGVVPFSEWVEKVLHPHFVSRYKEIKEKYVKTDGVLRSKAAFKREPKPKKKKTKRSFSWKAIKGIVDSEPTTEKGKRLQKYWKTIWELHEKHPKKKYAELKTVFQASAKK